MLDDRLVHPIIEHPHKYEIVRLDYQCDRENPRDNYLDLSLRRDGVTRRLRFLRPQRLIIEEGFPAPTGGMEIFDIRHQQWDDIRVEVSDFEASHGAITSYAADVIDLDEVES